MPTLAYAIIRSAIRQRRSICGRYAGTVCEFYPYALGHTGGVETLVALQAAADPLKRKTMQNEWRCLRLDVIENVDFGGEIWVTAHVDERYLSTSIENIELQAVPRTVGKAI